MYIYTCEREQQINNSRSRLNDSSNKLSDKATTITLGNTQHPAIHFRRRLDFPPRKRRCFVRSTPLIITPQVT